MALATDRGGAARAAVLEAARTGAYDRYAAALLAPQPARDGLLALAAFAAELSRIAPATRREPRMGEIRLQWWREALGDTGTAVSGHPVADAVKAEASVHAWPVASLLDIVDAHAHDGLVDAFADDQGMLATLALGEATLFRLGAQTCGAANDAGLATLSTDAGIAYGIARRLAALPQLVAQGHLPLPQTRLVSAGIDVAAILAGDAQGLRGVLLDLADLARDKLASASRDLARLPRKNRVAFLPLALVAPYLQTATDAGRNPLREMREMSPFARLLRLVGMHILGRI